MTRVLIRWPCEDRNTQEESNVTMKAGTGVTPLQGNECHRLPANHQKLGRAKEGLPHRFQRGRGPANTLVLDFWPPEL